jgi:hypothetical protein
MWKTFWPFVAKRVTMQPFIHPGNAETDTTFVFDK